MNKLQHANIVKEWKERREWMDGQVLYTLDKNTKSLRDPTKLESNYFLLGYEPTWRQAKCADY